MAQETAPPQRVSGRLTGLRRPLVIVLVYLVSWFVLDLATENLQGQLDVSLWFPPAGLNAALLLVCGVRYAPAMVLTTLLHVLMHRGGVEYPVWLLVVLPVLYTAVYAGAVALLVRVFKMDPRLPRMRDVLYFVGVACLAVPALGSAVSIAGYAIGERIPWSESLINILGGWAGDATGVGVVATILLIGLRPFPSVWSSLPDQLEEGSPRTTPEGFRLPERREIPELLGQTALLAVAVFVAYGTERGVQLDFAYLVFLPLIWVALRADLARTMLCVLLINVGAVLLIGGVVNNTNPILIQLGLVTLTIVGLLLGGLVNERQETSARLIHEASHDRLTGLPNRASFLDALSELLARAPGGSFMVVVVDLDRFANINNALGHQAGDGLRVTVGERLQGFADATENFTVTRVSRIGGDSFAVLIEGADTGSQPGQSTERLLEELALPYEYLGGDEVYVTASAGAVVIDETVQEAEELLRDADTALQSAKSKGPSRYEIFDEKMGATARARLELDRDLRRAVERGELVLHYQPVFSLETHTVVGAEALVRWEHPVRGLLSPAEFIPLAEQSGLIVPVGEWIVREACRQAKSWQETAPSQSPIVVSVNLSARQLECPGLPDEIHTALQDTGLDPSMLVLEITESTLVDNAKSVHDTLGNLREYGVRLAVDDFGTGYSSLSYLSRLPVDIIKIDRSFVSRLSQDSDTDGEFVEPISYWFVQQ